MVLSLVVATACGGDDPVECTRDEAAGPPSSLVAVPTPGGGTVLIEATEVTRAQYRRFLETAAPDAIEAQEDHCRWNTTFQPDVSCLGADDDPELTCDLFPQVCVDWCDAAAYCRHIGRRLCGAFGGGPVAPADFERASASEWINACSSGGRYEYGFGEPEDATECAGVECIEAGICQGLVDVGSLEGCQSPESEYAGVFDLSGNVREWTNACTAFAGASDECVVRGGNALLGGSAHSCYTAPQAPRSSTSAFTGFRCCADVR